jgi:hypothetical protein
MTAKKISEVARGITLLTEVEGQGPPAARGNRIIFNIEIWLNRSDEVPLNAIQVQHVPEQMVRSVAGEKPVDHTATLEKREVERSLINMKAGGYRKVRVSPHLAYRATGLPGLIPEHAGCSLSNFAREQHLKGEHEALIEEGLFSKVQSVRRNRGHSSTKLSRVFLLKRLYRSALFLRSDRRRERGDRSRLKAAIGNL